jgi:hypothetical protein
MTEIISFDNINQLVCVVETQFVVAVVVVQSHVYPLMLIKKTVFLL